MNRCTACGNLTNRVDFATARCADCRHEGKSANLTTTQAGEFTATVLDTDGRCRHFICADDDRRDFFIKNWNEGDDQTRRILESLFTEWVPAS